MKTKETVERCDNPACRYEEIVGEEPAVGYHFGSGKDLTGAAGLWVLAGGGPIPAFYAHQLECILPALEYVMDDNREYR